MTSRAQMEELLSHLTALHASLHAEVVHVGAAILTLKNAIAAEREAAEGEEKDDVVVCPTCGTPEGKNGPAPAGTDEEGNPEYVCACLGPSFVVKRRS